MFPNTVATKLLISPRSRLKPRQVQRRICIGREMVYGDFTFLSTHRHSQTKCRGKERDVHTLSLRCLPTRPKRSQSLSPFHRITLFVLPNLPHQSLPLRTLDPLPSKFVWGPRYAEFPPREGLSFGGVSEGREEVRSSLSGGTIPSS